MMPSLSSDPSPVSPAGALLRYRLGEFSDDWIIPEIEVPEAVWHDGCLELFKALLAAWVAKSARDAAVFRDLAVLAKRHLPRVGFNPDVILVEPAPPQAAELSSLRLWEHTSPRLAFEAVSPDHPYKDYVIIPEKCAITGVAELVVFDPLLRGPKAVGGPWLLQLWQTKPDGAFERVYAGSGAAWSAVLGAWLIPDREARQVRIADGADGSSPWLTAEEQAREAEMRSREREQQARQREQQARERETAALARVAELEAELARRGG